MKKILILILLLSFFNCGSNKSNLYEAQKWIHSQTFKAEKPNDWRPIKHHGYVGYTPIKLGNNHYDALASVFQYKLTEKPEFKEFVQNQIELTIGALNIISQDLLTEKNELGEVFIHTFESTWNGKVSKRYTVYFQRKEEYYYYSYAAIESNYERYFDDAISILKSLEFKN